MLSVESEVAPEEILTRVPGVGKKLASQLHEELGVDSLEELETAAHDGRLEEFPGIGEKRLAGIRDALAGNAWTMRTVMTATSAHGTYAWRAGAGMSRICMAT
jgi:DNA polymerase/3'-5' exonuclease PolX